VQKYIDKINTLIESFPYIREFIGKTVVIKYGGNAMIDEKLKKSFAEDMTMLKLVGINPVVVHGGGPQIGRLLEQVGKKTEFVDGLRVTDDETMEIVEMVLVGKVNKEIVNNIHIAGGNSVGISGKDGELIIAEKLFHGRDNVKIDIGQVGTVKKVNPGIIRVLEEDRYIPVIAPIGAGEDGQTFNINADIAAGRIAEAIGAEKLILLTDISGVMIGGQLASSLSTDEVAAHIESGEINGGMIPKVGCCVDAVASGVPKAHIVDGRLEHAVLLEIFTDSGIGTEIVS